MKILVLSLAVLIHQATAIGRECPAIPTDKPCCESGFTYVDLSLNPDVDVLNNAPGVSVITTPQAQSGVSDDCSKMALLKINFEKISKEPCYGCLRCPMCGRRMVRIDLELSSGTRKGWGFNLGDSRTNNGYAGDGSTQTNDAEIDGIFPKHINVWTNDKCPKEKKLHTFIDAIAEPVKKVTIYASNQHVRVVNDQGLDEYICEKNECLYALNGQSEIEGSINQDLYLGLNRVISGTYRNGVGVCSATISWACDECPSRLKSVPADLPLPLA